MSKVTVTESHLEDIGDAIRGKLGTSQGYTPGQMAAAIESIPTGGITPTGTKNITQNGQTDVTQYATADVNVPNSYAAGDEGKVVSNGALVAQTARASEITVNGTYDTTENNSVKVNVSGGGGGGNWPFIDEITEGGTGFSAAVSGSDALDTSSLPVNLQTFYASYCRTPKPTTIDYNIVVSEDDAGLTLSELKAAHPMLFTMEYYGVVYGNTSMIQALGLVLLGDFSQGGATTGNVLEDSIENYSAVILQGIYQKQRTSSYNTSMLYYQFNLGVEYWAGMKDRNTSYDCMVTFTDDQTVSLTGNKQVIIYGVP